jgi:hypothetical protein
MSNHHSRPGSSRRLCLAAAVVIVLTLASALAGCGGDDGETGTDEPPATDQPDGTTDQSGGGSDVDTPTDDDPGGGSSTNELADGSGCTPGTETGLPDGRWYGFAERGGEPGEVDFDLACLFSGDAAAAAAAEDGEESPPPNDYYTRNVNPLIRTLAVGEGTMVIWYPDIGDPASKETVTFDEWVGRRGRGGELGVWIETSDGEITAIEERWVP